MKYTIQQVASLLAGNPDLAADIQIECSLAPAAQQLSAHESERDMQARIVAECDRRALKDERWAMLHAVPNGQYRSGERMEPGLRRGYPDLALDVAAGGWHGLRIELKTAKGTLSLDQRLRLKLLGEYQYYACVCRSYEDAIEAIERYLDHG